MKTLCAILLVGVVTVTYVRALNDCAPFAVNVEESTIERQYPNVNEKYLSLTDALFKFKGVFRTTHATPTTIAAVANGYCTAATYGIENCGGVEYARKLNPGHDKINRDSLFEGIKFETTFIGFAKNKNMCVEYKMTFGGHDKDNYIFKWVDDTLITPMAFHGNNHNSAVSAHIPDEILNVLKSEFALYSYKTGRYNLFVTCDGKAAWVTYRTSDDEPKEMDPNLQTDIEKLTNLVRETKGIHLEVRKTNREFPDGLTDYLKNLYPEPSRRY